MLENPAVSYFSAPDPAVSLCVDQHLLQREASLMRAESINLCIKFRVGLYYVHLAE